MPKQNSRKAMFAGIEFDSTLEKERYIYLLSLEQEGLISHLTCQPQFEIVESAMLLKNSLRLKRRIRGARIYTADFMYVYQGATVIEDVKAAYSKTKGGHKRGSPIVSEASRLRMRIVQGLHPECVVVMVMRPTWWWGESGGHKLL